MDNKTYGEYIEKFKPEENKLKKDLIAFLIGGFIGIIGQVLIDIYIKMFNLSYNASANLMIVTLIFFSCLFTALGFFDTWVQKAGAGLFIPITGFAHSTTASTMDCKKEGLIFGMGSNMFKLSGSVILYGTLSAYIFGIIRILLFGG